jgi:hypothetical protein
MDNVGSSWGLLMVQGKRMLFVVGLTGSIRVLEQVHMAGEGGQIDFSTMAGVMVDRRRLNVGALKGTVGRSLVLHLDITYRSP